MNINTIITILQRLVSIIQTVLGRVPPSADYDDEIEAASVELEDLRKALDDYSASDQAALDDAVPRP